jgi:hypothetical protein
MLGRYAVSDQAKENPHKAGSQLMAAGAVSPAFRDPSKRSDSGTFRDLDCLGAPKPYYSLWRISLRIHHQFQL